MENTQYMPLDGIRVLEAGNYVQAPVATRLLADFGAEVIKIEEPGRGDGCRSIIHLRGVPNTIHKGGSWLIEHNLANKKSVAINLKTEEGKGVLYKLVEKSDVFVQN